MTKPHAQAKSDSARPALSANQEDILPLKQMMAPDETNVQAQPSTEQDNNGTLSPAPELRFEGFFEPWHKRQLMDVAQIIGGGTPSTSIKAYWDGSINWFTPAELGDQVFVSHSERQITQQGVEQSSAKLLPQGTVLFTSRAGIGKTAILTTPSTTNQGFQSIVPNPKLLDSYFIFSCSNQLKAYGENVGGGSTFKEVSGKQMEVMPLLTPSLPEQQRIGALFKELDRNLSLNRAQLEKLTQLKTSMLEQMFPQEGEDVPRLRFDGFTEPWHPTLLKDAVTSLDYGLNAPAKPFDFKTKYLRIKDIDEVSRTFSTDDLTSPNSDLIDSDKYLANEGDLFFARTGSIGRTYLYSKSEGRVIFAGYLIRCKIRQNLFSPNFIFYNTITNSYYSFVKATSARSVQPGINAQEYGSYQFMAPSLVEQERIGAFFQALDERLALQRAKIEKLEQLKKALLEQMFV